MTSIINTLSISDYLNINSDESVQTILDEALQSGEKFLRLPQGIVGHLSLWYATSPETIKAFEEANWTGLINIEDPKEEYFSQRVAFTVSGSIDPEVEELVRDYILRANALKYI